MGGFFAVKLHRPNYFRAGLVGIARKDKTKRREILWPKRHNRAIDFTGLKQEALALIS